MLVVYQRNDPAGWSAPRPARVGPSEPAIGCDTRIFGEDPVRGLVTATGNASGQASRHAAAAKHTTGSGLPMSTRTPPSPGAGRTTPVQYAMQ